MIVRRPVFSCPQLGGGVGDEQDALFVDEAVGDPDFVLGNEPREFRMRGKVAELLAGQRDVADGERVEGDDLVSVVREKLALMERRAMVVHAAASES